MAEEELRSRLRGSDLDTYTYLQGIKQDLFSGNFFFFSKKVVFWKKKEKKRTHIWNLGASTHCPFCSTSEYIFRLAPFELLFN